jgi:hypothetical protein
MACDIVSKGLSSPSTGGLVEFEISSKGNSRTERTKEDDEGDSQLQRSEHIIFAVSPTAIE